LGEGSCPHIEDWGEGNCPHTDKRGAELEARQSPQRREGGEFTWGKEAAPTSRTG
jgi:hypothetical protein